MKNLKTLGVQSENMRKTQTSEFIFEPGYSSGSDYSDYSYSDYSDGSDGE